MKEFLYPIIALMLAVAVGTAGIVLRATGHEEAGHLAVAFLVGLFVGVFLVVRDVDRMTK